MATPDVRSVKLGKNANLLDVVMLGAGAAIGSSIFSVLGPATEIAGSSLLFAIVLAGVPMGILAVVYAFVASAVPKSGASYEWPREFIHPMFGFFIAWMRVMSSAGLLLVMGIVLVDYVSDVVALPKKTTILALFFVVYLLNLLGISLAAKAQTAFMILLMVAFTIYIATALPNVETAHLGGIEALELTPMLLALPLLIQLFMGIETATEIGEEVEDGERTIPKAIGLAVALTVVVYLAVAGTTLALLGPERLAASKAPLLEASRLSASAIATPVMFAAATLCLLKSLNVSFMIFARNLFVMGRGGVLPPVFTKIHPKWGTPHVATTVAFVVPSAGLLLPDGLVFLLIAVSIPTLLKYLSTCLCALVIATKRTDVYERARFKPSRNAVIAWAGLGAICAIAVFFAGLETDSRPYLLFVGWLALGAGYWFYSKRYRPEDL